MQVLKMNEKSISPLSVDDDDGDAGRCVSKPAFKTACSAIDFKDDMGSSFWNKISVDKFFSPKIQIP